MTIAARRNMPTRIEIDLGGPQGNAFYLIGAARNLAKQLGRDPDAISAEMQAGNYDHLLEVFEREFGDFVTLYRAYDDEEDEYEEGKEYDADDDEDW